MKSKILAIIANTFAVFLLTALIIAPIYFANNFSQVAGVKTESKYLLISQTDKFPQMKFSQEDKRYQLTFQKQGNSQAFLSVFILNNPTAIAQSYTINVNSGQGNIFFGDDINNQQTTVTVPPSASVPISMISTSQILFEQSIEFLVN